MRESSTSSLITCAICIFGIFAFVSYIFFYNTDSEEPESTSNFYVHDDAEILSQEVEDLIIDVNKDYESTSEKPQIVVSTVESLDGLSIEEYALESFETLEIGSKNSDNGVLILISEKERQVRIEVGYGLEGAITDSYIGRLLDENIDYLKDNDYNSAVGNLFKGISSSVNKEYNLKDSAIISEDMPIEDDSYTLKDWLKLIALAFVLCFGVIGTSLSGGLGGSSGGGGRSGGGGSSRSF